MLLKKKWHKERYFLVIFWMLCFIAVGVRTLLFGKIPAGINADEAMIGYNALNLLLTGEDSWGVSAPVYLNGWGSGTGILYVLLAKICFYLFGVSVVTLRLPQVMMGCISCLVFYRLLRLCYDKKIALLGLFFIGIMPWFVMNARWALDANIAPAFWLLGFYFYCCAVKNNGYLFLSVIFYALTMYAYAAYWVFVLITLSLQWLYLLYVKRDRQTFCYLLFSGVLYLLIIAPLLWLVMVNYGWLEAYKSERFSVPQLLVWRGDEVGFENFRVKFQMLFNVLIKQNDGWLSNVIPAYGLFYLFSPLFMVVGMGVLIKEIREDIKARRFSFSLCILVQIIVGLLYGCLVYAFSNRVNFLFFPLLVALTLGVWVLKRCKVLFYFVLSIYIAGFICFTHTYFLKYNLMLMQNTPFSFSYGFEDALYEAEIIHQKNHAEIYMVESPYAYMKVLFFNHINPWQYRRTVQWHNYPAPFVQAARFLYYNFAGYVDVNHLNEKYIYIVHKDHLPYFQNWVVKTYGSYIVAYKNGG